MRAKEFFAFMKERETIRLKRAAGLPAPWTDDVVLQNYKFTNVKRYHDKTSMELIKRLYEPNRAAPREQVLLNAALSRYFGTWEFMTALGWQEDFRPKEIKNLAKARLAEGQRVFTGAYVITNNGMKGAKQDVVVDMFIADLWKQRANIIKTLELTWRWQRVIERLADVRGFGGTGFMAKETILDTRYTDFWKQPAVGDGGDSAGLSVEPTDLNSWTPVGPGSLRGAQRVLLGNADKPATAEKTLSVCRALFAGRAKFWPANYVPLELHDIQFQLCEFDKYERVQRGEGTPRSRFKGGPGGS